MEFTKREITDCKGKTVFDPQLLGKLDENAPVNQGDLSDIFVRTAALEEELRTRLAKMELSVTKFRGPLNGEEHGNKIQETVSALKQKMNDFMENFRVLRGDLDTLLGNSGTWGSKISDLEQQFVGLSKKIEDKEGLIQNVASLKVEFERFKLNFGEVRNEILSKGDRHPKILGKNFNQTVSLKSEDADSVKSEDSDGNGSEYVLKENVVVNELLGDNSDTEDWIVEVFETGRNSSITPFTGEGETSFTEWLARFKDLGDAQNTPWTADQKLRKLKFFLEGVAREKFEQLSTAEKGDFELAVAKLTSFFENSMTRNIARQGLRNCRQIKGESVRAFFARLKRLVTAATVGQGDAMFQQLLLDEFCDRLEPKLAFHVKSSQPTTSEEALNRALHMEHLIEAEKIAKEEEVEKIAGIVRLTLQNDAQSNEEGDIFAVKQGPQNNAAQFSSNRMRGGMSQSNQQNYEARQGNWRSAPSNSQQRSYGMNQSQGRNNFSSSRGNFVNRDANFNYRPQSRNYNRRIVCFRCGSVGHPAFKCFQNLGTSGSNHANRGTGPGQQFGQQSFNRGPNNSGGSTPFNNGRSVNALEEESQFAHSSSIDTSGDLNSALLEKEEEISHLKRMYQKYGDIFCALQESDAEVNCLTSDEEDDSKNWEPISKADSSSNKGASLKSKRPTFGESSNKVGHMKTDSKTVGNVPVWAAVRTDQFKWVMCDFCELPHSTNECWVKHQDYPERYQGVALRLCATELSNRRYCRNCQQTYISRFKVCRANHLLGAEMQCPTCFGKHVEGMNCDPVVDCLYCAQEENQWTSRTEMAHVVNTLLNHHPGHRQVGRCYQPVVNRSQSLTSLRGKQRRMSKLGDDNSISERENEPEVNCFSGEDDEIDKEFQDKMEIAVSDPFLPGLSIIAGENIDNTPVGELISSDVVAPSSAYVNSIPRNALSKVAGQLKCDLCGSLTHHFNDCWIRKSEGDYMGVAFPNHAYELVDFRQCATCKETYDARFKVCHFNHVLEFEIGCPNCKGLVREGITLDPVDLCISCNAEYAKWSARRNVKRAVSTMTPGRLGLQAATGRANNDKRHSDVPPGFDPKPHHVLKPPVGIQLLPSSHVDHEEVIETLDQIGQAEVNSFEWEEQSFEEGNGNSFELHVKQMEPNMFPNRGQKQKYSSLKHVVTSGFFLLLVNFTAGANSGSPMRCQTHIGRSIVKIPDAVHCPNISLFRDEPVERITFSVFRPNTVEYQADSTVCKQIGHSFQYRTRWWGAHELEKDKKKFMDVDLRDCRKMIEASECRYGKLAQVGNLWKTDNSIQIEWPWPILGGNEWIKNITVNCYRYSSIVLAKFGDDAITTTAGTPDLCSFKDGFCHLKEGPVLLWKPDVEQQCSFIPMGVMSGTKLGNAWITDSRDFALSFDDHAGTVESCGRTLVLSDQGYAVIQEQSELKRIKRSLGNSTGYVSSNQLAAQLTADSLGQYQALKQMFQASWDRMCRLFDGITSQLHVGLASQPTMAARALLLQHNLFARVVGWKYLEIWPCEEIEDGKWGFLNASHTFVGNICHTRPAIWYRWLGDETYGYLDPVTNIIWETSSERPCSEKRETLLYVNMQLIAVDQVTGFVKRMDSQVRDLFQDKIFGDTPNITRVLFRNLVITNFSEITSQGHLQAFMHAMKVEQNFHEGTQVTEKLNGDSQYFHHFHDSWLGMLWNFDAWKIWLYVCCGVYTVEWIFRILKTYVKCQVDKALGWFRKRILKNTQELAGDVVTELSVLSQCRQTNVSSLSRSSKPRQSFRNRLPWPLSARQTPAEDIELPEAEISTFESSEQSPPKSYVSPEIYMHLVPAMLGLPISFTNLYGDSNLTCDSLCGELNVSNDFGVYLSESQSQLRDTIDFWGNSLLFSVPEEIVGAIVRAVQGGPRVKAQVMGYLNGLPLPMLIDTGSDMTLAAFTLRNVIRADTVPTSRHGKGISGAGLDLREEATVSLQLGTHKREVSMYFSWASHLQTRSYEVLVGTDALMQFPPFLMDLANRTIQIFNYLMKSLPYFHHMPRNLSIGSARRNQFRPSVIVSTIFGSPRFFHMWNLNQKSFW
ncbi:retrotransposon gag protein domain-containing protein [Ditylenchus destructor]|uniref:Retrotransposon gag protein domain-containing protein n=1 Tax=Ditylenchus destructor TaxID=166010 RepID=A0AAD4R8T7_9BILA|nr:retrotransposon gag protein domain-containing protein [Ditylenchus destructor]